MPDVPLVRADRRDPGPVIEQWADATAEVHGFRDVNHRIEMFGTCPACAAGRTMTNKTS
jgi:Fe2+ or Zn2+ uptake regulation protein